jgi:hypothetical protein
VNLNTFGVVLFVSGVILMYAAVKNKDPRDVVLKALGQKERFGNLSNPVNVGKAGKFADPDEGFGQAPPPPTNGRWVSV